jgi:hypothetical protein
VHNGGIGAKWGSIAHGDPVRNEVTLVDDQHDLFVSLFFLDILQNGFAHRPHRVSRVQDMEDDI